MLKPSLIRRCDIDIPQWDALISSSLQNVIYAQSFYLDTICCDWSAFVWPSQDYYQIVMPVPTRRKIGFCLATLPLFCQYLGIFSKDELTPGQANAFLCAFSGHFRYVSCYAFNPENTNVLAPLMQANKAFRPAILHTEWLDLNRDYECIRAGYSKDREKNLAKGIAHEWNVIQLAGIGHVIELFRRNNAHNIQGGVADPAYEMLERLFTKLRVHCAVEVHYAHKHGEMHAGVLFVKYAGRVIYLFNAADAIGREQNARTFLLDRYFRKHASEPLCFDFECPEKDSIRHFYKSFGGTRIPFFQVSVNALPFPLKQIQEWRKRLKS